MIYFIWVIIFYCYGNLRVARMHEEEPWPMKHKVNGTLTKFSSRMRQKLPQLN